METTGPDNGTARQVATSITAPDDRSDVIKDADSGHPALGPGHHSVGRK